MPKILVTRRTFSEAAEALRASGAEVVIWDGEDAPSHQDLIDAVADVDGLYAHITNQVNDEVMDAAPNLKVISEFGVGYDNIDVNAANERGIAVCNTPGILSESTADEAFALLASMARRTYDLPAMVKRGEWAISTRSVYWRAIFTTRHSELSAWATSGPRWQNAPLDST